MGMACSAVVFQEITRKLAVQQSTDVMMGQRPMLDR